MTEQEAIHIEVDDPRSYKTGCKLSGPGRGDCEHFVGLPDVLDETTTDEYGIPHGWCDYCWQSHRLSALREQLRNRERQIEIHMEQLREAEKSSNHILLSAGKVAGEAEIENRRLRDYQDRLKAANDQIGDLCDEVGIERDRLRDAIGALTRRWSDHDCDIDGCDFQEVMVKHGIFVTVPASEYFRDEWGVDEMYVLAWSERALAEMAKEGQDDG